MKIEPNIMSKITNNLVITILAFLSIATEASILTKLPILGLRRKSVPSSECYQKTECLSPRIKSWTLVL
jgi:hypothetical protein